MPSQPITEEQFNRLIYLIGTERNPKIIARDIIFYKILYYLGLRPSEARLIKIQNINFTNQEIFIPAENNKQRNADNVSIPDFLWVELLAYINSLESQWLFPSCSNHNNGDRPVHQRMCERSFNRRMKSLGFLQQAFIDKQGIPRYNLNIYSFRKRFGTFVYKKTKCPQQTANMLRQYDPTCKSVWTYIVNARKEERKEILKQIYA